MSEDQHEGLTAQERQELTGIIEQRIATYGLLSRLFYREVDQALLDELKEAQFPANSGNANIDKGYRLLVAYLSKIWENSVSELAIDFSQTFIGHGVDAFSAAYPFESVHTSEKRLLMQDVRDEVVDLYRRANLKKRSDWKEGEDHISMEMEYVMALSNRTVEALRKGDENRAYHLLKDQHSFLSEHLCAWTPMMTADMKRLAKTDFYRGLAWLTDGFLETDLEFLEDVLRED